MTSFLYWILAIYLKILQVQSKDEGRSFFNQFGKLKNHAEIVKNHEGNVRSNADYWILILRAKNLSLSILGGMSRVSELVKKKTIIQPQRRVKKSVKDEPTILLGSCLKILLMKG